MTMAIFNLRDVFNIAVKIEEQGEQFYRKVASLVESETVKELFNKLANDEVSHKAIFSRMAADLGEINLSKIREGEFEEYLNAYTEKLIFDTSETFIEELSRNFDLAKAIQYAMDRELESVLFYKEIKEIVADSEKGVVENIIKEEYRHFVNLNWLKKQLRQ